MSNTSYELRLMEENKKIKIELEKVISSSKPESETSK